MPQPQWYTDIEAALEAETNKQQAVGFVLHLCSKVLRGIHPSTDALVKAIPSVNLAAAVTGHRIEDVFPQVAVVDDVSGATLPPATDADVPAAKGKKSKPDA